MFEIGAKTTKELGAEALAAWVQSHGAMAAAWLIWTHKRHFVKHGVFDFRIPAQAITPAWFRVAIATLEDRERWMVQTIQPKSDIPKTIAMRVYRVRWLGKGRSRRG